MQNKCEMGQRHCDPKRRAPETAVVPSCQSDRDHEQRCKRDERARKIVEEQQQDILFQLQFLPAKSRLPLAIRGAAKSLWPIALSFLLAAFQSLKHFACSAQQPKERHRHHRRQ